MKILLVEDNLAVSEATKFEIEKIIGVGSVTTAASKESACLAVNHHFYDLIVLDLSLPPTDDSLDDDVSHGQAVFGFCQSHAPGTPICFLTGSSTHRFVMQLLNQHANRQDFWGDGESTSSPMIFPKIDLIEFLDHLRDCFTKLKFLSDIELRPLKAGDALQSDQQRILKIFTKRLAGASCKWQNLKGGLSDVKVLSLEILNDHDSPLFKAVARIGRRSKIANESKNFDLMVPALNIGTYPSKLLLIEYGAKSSAGIFYRLASDHTNNLSDLLISDPVEAASVCEKLQGILSVWGEGCHTSRKSIAELRQCLVNNDKSKALAEEFNLDWQREIEELTVSVKWGRTHGDLHGGNILISNDRSPILIDFGDLAERATSLDPCSILLSPFFHPDTAERAIGIISLTELIETIDKLHCSSDLPYAQFLNNVISWLNVECLSSERSIYASLYVYALKQLQYPDTDKQLGCSIIDLCKLKINATR
jgi:CheY-like chemotaxis protein